MINNFFKQGIRRITNQPLFSGIKFFGLTIGISCVLLISLWVQNELSFDKFHLQSDNIYRVIMNMGDQGNIAYTPSPLIDKIRSDFPELEFATRVENCPKMIVKSQEKNYYESGGIFADPAFFDVFSFDLLQGNRSNLLDNPFSIVISEAFAAKYYTDNNVLNKTLMVHGYPFQITGVLKNVPNNSHLQFDFILPIQLKLKLGFELNNWGDANLYTYIKAKEHTKFTSLNEKIKNWKTPRSETFFLQPLLKIHSETDILANNAKVTNKKYVFIFSSVAFLILLIASINYITLFLSSAFSRSKEIGILKIIGSNRKRLILNFVGESAIYIIISLFLACMIIQLFMPIFNRGIGSQLSFSFANGSDLLGVIILGIALLLIIGIYPAIHLSSHKPSSIFKNNKGDLGLISKFKNGMVLMQFSITTLLIVCMLQVSKQLDYIQNKDLGFNKENVVYMPYGGIAEHYPAFKQKLLENSSILNVSIKNSLPIEVSDKTTDLSWPGKNPETKLLIEATGVGFNYFETMGVNVIEGRDFSQEIASDKLGVILNQKAVKMMDLSDPVGKTIQLWEYTVNVIGVTNDALFYSLKENASPQIYYMVQDYLDESLSLNGVLLVKISDKDIDETMATLKSVWSEFAPETPFDYHFLDQAIDRQYWSEKRIYAIMKFFVFLSIFLSCLGLFGVATFSTQQRTKEIGVRKVNGATVSEVMFMLNRDFIKWVIIAPAIATPIAYYAMYNWLESFAYKTELSWWIFATAGLLALGIALLTVSWLSWRAGRKNPIESLRYE